MFAKWLQICFGLFDFIESYIICLFANQFNLLGVLTMEQPMVSGSVTTTCFAFSTSGDEIITGNVDGVIMVWKDDKVSRVLKETHQVQNFSF
jgi:hypothetical protein